MIVLKRFTMGAGIVLAGGTAATSIGLYAMGQRQVKANAGQAADGAKSKDEPDSLAGKKRETGASRT